MECSNISFQSFFFWKFVFNKTDNTFKSYLAWAYLLSKIKEINRTGSSILKGLWKCLDGANELKFNWGEWGLHGSSDACLFTNSEAIRIGLARSDETAKRRPKMDSLNPVIIFFSILIMVFLKIVIQSLLTKPSWCSMAGILQIIMWNYLHENLVK